jgi:hypothetical protein
VITRTAAAVLAAMLLATACGGAGESRQEEVARKGAEVMPFDLDLATHKFESRPWGGIQTVVADDPADKEQVAVVRAHLREEATAFARGDVSDPAAIHGASMPGLDELRAAAGRIEIAYLDVSAGGRITYRTGDGRLVEALHAWFAAQVSDHGEHASAMTGTG